MKKRTLLVVDDIEMNRSIVSKFFEEEFTVLEASNGKEALELIESSTVEIVITDIFMNPMNGYELIQNIRAKKEYKQIPIIAVTESDQASRKKALKAGADDLVYKPLIGNILQNRVKGLLYDSFDLNRYKLAYENNPVPFAVYHVIDRPDTPSYKILYMNKAAKDSYSPPYNELIIQTDESPDIRDLLLLAIHSGDTVRKSIYEPKMNKWLDWTIYPDGHGLVATMIHDITQDIDTQTAIANTTAKKAISDRNHVSEIVENYPNGIFVFELVDNDIIIEEVNRIGCQLLDVDPSKIIGVHKEIILSFVHPEDRKDVIEAMKVVSVPNKTVSYRCRIKNRSKNRYVWFFAQAKSKKRADGNVDVFISYTDISVEKELEDTKLELLVAKKANMAKTDFLSRVSHDMRTPLNGIIGLTEIIKEKVMDESVLQDIEQLELSSKYLLNLVTDTLDVSRIENGKLELHPTVCEGRTVLNNVLSLAKKNMEQKHLHFIVKAENLPFSYLYIDVGRLEQVAMNIIGNAIKFTPEGGTITCTMKNISVKDNIIWDELIVEDTGVGMSKEFLPHMFESFTQENNGITSSTNGTGIGMIITKSIVEVMGGTIQAESEKDKGTKVTVSFPMHIATDEQIKEWKEKNSVVYDEQSLAEKRVLLCEDHELNAKIATRLLEKKGMKVEHACNGSVGVEMFKASTEGYYDIVLMDIRMPIMDGITATRQIRALPRVDAKTIPIIAMTANAFEEDVKQSKAAGMNEHLSKPIDTNKLYESLERNLHLNRSFKRRTILVVDDVEVNREIVKENLQDEYVILEATNGKEAMHIIENTKGIDVVITDIQMPEMDGIELIQTIRSNPLYNRISILANTQYGDPAQEEELLKMGADDFIYKPTSPAIVKSRVRLVLKK